MCQNRDRSYRNAGRTLRVHAPSIIRRAEGEKGLAARAAYPLKISNLFHFKVPAPIGIRAKKSRRTYTITYRMENGTYMGWTSRVTLLPTPIAYDTCVLATSGTTTLCRAYARTLAHPFVIRMCMYEVSQKQRLLAIRKL